MTWLQSALSGLTDHKARPARRRPRARPALEALECRDLLSGVHDPLAPALGAAQVAGAAGDPQHDVTPSVVTPHDTLPDFGAHPTITAARSGRWSDPNTWSLGRLPGAGDVVTVGAGVQVEYDLVSDARLDSVVIQAGGQLRFQTEADTRLLVGNLVVLEGGFLEIGTPDRSVAAHARAEVVIADLPIDTVRDPRQYGTGLLALGKVTMHGAAKAPPFTRLAVEPRPGDTTLTLSDAPVGWQAGDRLVLPPSGVRARAAWWDPGATEALTVAAVQGNVVTLTAPLQGEHYGARDGDGRLDFLPHVANLTRNVVVRSENPAGTRGHTMFLHRAEVDLRYVQFKDLGRTTDAPLDSTQVDDLGNVTHLGTNQVGRYAVHLHHLLGAPNPTNEGYQFRLVGNAVDGGRKWGVALHDAHYGLLEDNVVYDVQHAGVVTEDGSESYNLIRRNFVVQVAGSDTGPTSPASGFWLEGARNYFRDNVVARAGNGYYLPPNLDNQRVFHIPAARGADPAVPGQAEEVSWVQSTFRAFTGNEAYSVRAGVYFDHRHGGAAQGGHLVKDFRVWSSFGNVDWGVAAAAYDTDGVVYDGLVARGASVDVYSNAHTTVRNSDIQGADVGIRDASHNGALVVENTFLRNDTNVTVALSLTAGAGPLPAGPIRTTLLDNVRYAAPAGRPLVAVSLTASPGGLASRVPVLGNVVEVRAHNGVAGDDFRVYFHEQHPDRVVPYLGDIPADPIFVRAAAPERGLTNRVAWARYGLAFAGAVAPPNATTREGVNGLVAPVRP